MPNAYDSWRTGVQIDNIYPVGSVYISVNSTNPGSLFGGTWEQINNVFLLAQGSSYAAGSTGGSTTMAHTHSQVAVTTGGPSNNTSGGPSNNTSGSTAITVAQMPAHRHTMQRQQWWNVDNVANSATNSIFNWRSGAGSGGNTSQTFTENTVYAINNTGGGQGHTHTLSSHTHTLSSHTHDITATTTGAASNTNNMPPYLTVYMWKRIS